MMSLNESKHALFVAQWETKTGKKIQVLDKLREMDKIQSRHAQTLEERRARLAQLLAAEQREYENALQNMVETQDQRRERMASKALELRNNREAKRSAMAQAKMDQAFQESCDPLRAALSRNNTLQVAEDRQQQIELNAQRRRREAEEDKFWTEMAEAERLKKVQRAKEDLMRVHATNAELRRNLDAQLGAYEAAKEQERQLKEEEDRLYREEVQLQLEMDARRERERRAERVALARRNREFNLSMRKQKDDEAKKEKDEDMRLLHELIARIKEEEERDITNKSRARREAASFMQALREQMGAEAENEAELERLWQVENEKEWAKKEARYKAEQEARDRLLKEVFEERHLQLELRRRTLQDRKEEQQRERERMLGEMEALTLIERERVKQQRSMAMQQRDHIVQQIREKEMDRYTTDREKLLERAAAEIAEAELQAKVADAAGRVQRGEVRVFGGVARVVGGGYQGYH